MGEVYRARDSRLERDVAIKILPAHWLEDPARRVRFEREARVLASLNHPHIGAIYGFEESAGLRALVLELIEGPTLKDRLAGGPLAVAEALRVAAQIADALEGAHERGIIHRDLKPANVILGVRRSPSPSAREGAPRRDALAASTESMVKVVDFGVAKETAAAVGIDSESPTVTAAATSEGALLGTAAYMSPEQARGAEIDKRTDVWAFGCVLYEMLTGRAPFARATVPDTLAALLGSEPDWSALPEATPRAVRQMLRRCLEKDWRRRLHDAGDARIAIEDAVAEPDAAPIAATTSRRAPASLRRWLLLAPAALAIAAIAGWALRGALSSVNDAQAGPSSDAPEMRLEIVVPPPLDPAATSFAISPDGKKLAFVSEANGRSILWVRSLDALDAPALSGTEGALFPFWSPDAREIGFFADFQLKRVDVEVGTVQVIARAKDGRGGAWGRGDVIVFKPDPDAPLARVSSTGGAVVELPALRGRFPHFLPDGIHLLYGSDGAPSVTPGVYVAKVDGSGARLLVEGEGRAVYALGHLFFLRGTALVAQPFDPSTLTVSGNAFAVASGAGMNSRYHYALLSAAAAGPIVYQRAVSVRRQFIWVNRDGGVMARVGDPIEDSRSPELSPDGRLIAFHAAFSGQQHIWLMDIARGVSSRVQLPEGEFPVWSPDGSRLAFAVKGYPLYELSLRTGGEPRLIVTPPRPPFPGAIDDWSPDGRHLLCQNLEGLHVFPIDGRGDPIAVATSDFIEKDGVFSPDGKWIAYTSNESGEPQIYVQRFPGGTPKLRVSTTGGGMARWRGDGGELFYLALDGQLMAVPLRVDRGSGGMDMLEPLTPVPLFEADLGPPVDNFTKQQYMVAPDGMRFLLNAIVEDTTPPLTVILNWRPQASAPDRGSSRQEEL
jgi:Tol biopolymer transport system component